MKGLLFILLVAGAFFLLIFYKTIAVLICEAFILAVICLVFPGILYLLMVPVALCQEAACAVRDRWGRKQAAWD